MEAFSFIKLTQRLSKPERQENRFCTDKAEEVAHKRKLVTIPVLFLPTYP